MKRLAFIVLALCAGCAETDARPTDLQGHHARRLSGSLGMPAEATPLLGLFTVNARVNDAQVAMLVDTGAPLTFVSPASGRPRGPTRLRDLSVGAVTLYDVPAVVDDPFGLAPLIGGVLGVNVICQFSATWDWQRNRFTLGDPPTDSVVEDGESVVPFHLLGGGTFTVAGASVAVPATRIVVDAEVEGVTRALVLDTGASTTALRSDLVRELARDRASLSLRVTVQGGVATQQLLRVRGLRTMGIEAREVAVIGYDAAALRDIAAELGRPVDGLLGADLLRGHLLTVAYPEGRIRLRRYRDRSHVFDRWVRAGIIAGRVGGVWRVTDVFPGSGAARAGVSVGLSLLAIDGRPVQGMSLDAVDRALTGSVGELRALQTPAGEFQVPIEDVVPLR